MLLSSLFFGAALAVPGDGVVAPIVPVAFTVSYNLIDPPEPDPFPPIGDPFPDPFPEPPPGREPQPPVH